ncbi:uncharacterized protein LOC115631764 [Scaptodrosophila lebanonensis]|uniref:Uncharacterized protein LOC115631764 n=1 Tax=Drosophila lebanonensis TaxID=7225 RepID=A0A6J2U8Z6_DROLE|nr:uncharacterized protein LOC115631764 [Scaptodrosophila lebanonensis]
MRAIEKLAIAAALLCCMLQTAYAIKCWDCRSDNDPKCGDPFDNSTLAITDCQQAPELEHLKGVRPTMCRKIRQKVHGEWRYFRSCAYMGEPGIEGDERFCLMRTGSYNIFMEYCTCNSKDGCNGANGRGGSAGSVLLATFAVGLVAHFLRQ